MWPSVSGSYQSIIDPLGGSSHMGTTEIVSLTASILSMFVELSSGLGKGTQAENVRKSSIHIRRQTSIALILPQTSRGLGR